MKRLLILGAGGFGQEVAAMLPDHPDFGKEWEMVGFLDTRTDTGDIPSKYPILDREDSFLFRPDDLLILAIADPYKKEQLKDKLNGKVAFFTFIHPSSLLLNFSRIGEGCVIYPNCFISSNVRLGSFVTVNVGSQIGHDSSVGDFSSLMPHTDLGGGVQVGKHVFMGTKATVAPYKTIADGTKISAGSVVMRSVLQKNCTLMGNPAVKFE